MLAANADAIKSVLKRPSRRLTLIVVGFLLLMGSALAWCALSDGPDKPRVRIGQHAYALEVVRTQAEQERGLSGRLVLGDDRGMLFAYDTPARQCMWMKEMNFNIDMVWLDASRRVMKIERDLSPSTYPKTYCSDANAAYVLELPAGTAVQDGLQAGQQLVLEHI